jgi:hypothetical protein
MGAAGSIVFPLDAAMWERGRKTYPSASGIGVQIWAGLERLERVLVGDASGPPEGQGELCGAQNLCSLVPSGRSNLPTCGFGNRCPTAYPAAGDMPLSRK